MSFQRGLVLMLCSFSLLLLTACHQESAAEKTVHQFLEAYKANDQKATAYYLSHPDDYASPAVIQDFSTDLLNQYHHIFTDFIFKIEREELAGNRASVYVTIAYKDAGTPSLNAFNAYQANTRETSEDPVKRLEADFTNALSGNLTLITETIVVPLKADASGKWHIEKSSALQNALTGNLNVLSRAIEKINKEYDNDAANQKD